MMIFLYHYTTYDLETVAGLKIQMYSSVPPKRDFGFIIGKKKNLERERQHYRRKSVTNKNDCEDGSKKKKKMQEGRWKKKKCNAESPKEFQKRMINGT